MSDMMQRIIGLSEGFGSKERIMSEEVKREKASPEDIKEMRKKIKNFSDKVKKLEEEGLDLIKDLTSFRTPQGGFAFKGVANFQKSINKLRTIYGTMMFLHKSSVSKNSEKWSVKDE